MTTRCKKRGVPTRRASTRALLLALTCFASTTGCAVGSSSSVNAVVDGKPVMRIHDVTALLRPVEEFSVLPFGIDTSRVTQASGVGDARGMGLSMNAVIELLAGEAAANGAEADIAITQASATNVAVLASSATQAAIERRVAASRQAAAHPHGRVFRVTTRFFAETEELTQALTPLVARPRAQAAVLPVQTLDNLLARHSSPKPDAPQMLLFENRRAHTVVADQVAFIAGASFDASTQKAEPELAIMTTGFILDATARRFAAGRVHIVWKLSITAADRPSDFQENENGFSIELPTVAHDERQGGSVLSEHQALIVLDLPTHDSSSATTERQVAVITVREVSADELPK